MVAIQFVVKSDNGNKINFQGQVQRPNNSFESTFLFCSFKSDPRKIPCEKGTDKKLFSAII